MGCSSSKPSHQGQQISHPYQPTARLIGHVPDARTRQAAKYNRPPPPPPVNNPASIKRKPVAAPPAYQIAHYSAKTLPLKPSPYKQMPATGMVQSGKAQARYAHTIQPQRAAIGTVQTAQAKTTYVSARHAANGAIYVMDDQGVERRAKDCKSGVWNLPQPKPREVQGKIKYVRARQSVGGSIWMTSEKGVTKRAKDCRDGVLAEGVRVEWNGNSC